MEGGWNANATPTVVGCPDCHGPISSKAMTCPHCGRPIRKNFLVAGVLGVFFGNLGAHNFYMGRRSRGVVQMVMFVLGLLLLLGRSDIMIGDKNIVPFMLIGVIFWTFIETMCILMLGQDHVDKITGVYYISFQGTAPVAAPSDELPPL